MARLSMTCNACRSTITTTSVEEFLEWNASHDARCPGPAIPEKITTSPEETGTP